MTKEEYDKIVEPVAPFKEIEKKQKEPKTIAEYVEAVCGHELSKWQKEFITAIYVHYKTNHHSMNVPWTRGNDTSILPFLACVFAAYEGKDIKPCVVITKEE